MLCLYGIIITSCALNHKAMCAVDICENVPVHYSINVYTPYHYCSLQSPMFFKVVILLKMLKLLGVLSHWSITKRNSIVFHADRFVFSGKPQEEYQLQHQWLVQIFWLTEKVWTQAQNPANRNKWRRGLQSLVAKLFQETRCLSAYKGAQIQDWQHFYRGRWEWVAMVGVEEGCATETTETNNKK